MSFQLEKERLLTTFYSQAAEEHASRVLETHRIPDPYYFLIDQDGDLFSPSRQIKVKKIIDTNSPVGRLEAQAFESISRWVRHAESGAIAWISPPKPYPVSKIIISEIEKVNDKKRILNRAIVLDIDGIECLELGQRLSGFSINKPFLVHTEQLRATPIVMDITKKTWLEILEEVIPNTTLWEGVKRGEEMLAKKEALAEAEAILARYSQTPNFYYRRDQEMQAMLGKRPESCPLPVSSVSGKTAFQVVSENSIFYGGSSGSSGKDSDFCRVCPICQKEINCIVRTGGSCPKCGAVKKCG